MRSNISIIIPTLNEAGDLEGTLQSISSNTVLPLEIIVVDAGSRDETCAIAARAQCRLITGASPGRARQLNLGASQSKGDILLFLHGDTEIPPQGLAELHQKLSDMPRASGGGFSRRYRSPSLILKCTCQLADWRGSIFGMFLGDQAIFVRRTVFERLGGFRDMPLFEDLEFSQRMRQQGAVIRLRSKILSSARRFNRWGPLRTTGKDLRATWQYFQGEDPGKIHRSLKG